MIKLFIITISLTTGAFLLQSCGAQTRVFSYGIQQSSSLSASDPKEVTLQWDANTEANLKEYKVYYGMSADNLSNVVTNIGLTTNPSMPEINIRDLEKGKTYFFAVTAVDSAGNESDKSNIISKTP